MRYQLRLVDDDLVSFHRHLSGRCWSILAPLVPARKFRALNRRLKAVLSARVEAHAYCGQAFRCDAFLNPVERGQLCRESVPPLEAVHTNYYLLAPGATPGQLAGELSRECLEILADARPSPGIKGCGRRIRRAIRGGLKDRIYRNESCGEGPLCRVQKPIPLWSRVAVVKSAW